MEHRCSVRKGLEFQLLLYKHGLPIQSGVCRDLGLGGLFIETGERAWYRHECVEVEMLARDGRPSVRLPTVVVHYNQAGAGLMFTTVTDEQRRRLRYWLFGGRWLEDVRDVGTSRAVA